MCPESKYFYDAFLLINLVNESVLEIDSAGISAGKITNKLFVWWWLLRTIRQVLGVIPLSQLNCIIGNRVSKGSLKNCSILSKSVNQMPDIVFCH